MRNNDQRQSLDMSIHALSSEVTFLSDLVTHMTELDRICLKATQRQLNQLIEVLEKRVRVNQPLYPTDVLAMMQ